MKITYKNKRNIFLFVAVALFCLAYAVERPTIAYTIKEQISPTERNDFKEENILSTKQDKNLVTSQPFSGFDSTTDSDGDGIPDYLDLDDDNDGILDIDECPETSSSFLSYYNSGSYEGDIENWDIIASAQPSTIGNGLSRRLISPHNYMELRGINAANVLQSITNNEYVEYSFTTQNKYSFIKEIGYYSTNYISTGEDTQYHFSVRISKDNFSTNEILLANRAYDASTGTFVVPVQGGKYWMQPNTTYKVRVYFYAVNGGAAATIAHDDFRIYGFIECDTDGDGIPDRLDLDSDNDGCPDAIEGDGNISQSQLDADGRIIGGVDENGIPTVVGSSGQGIGQSQNAADFSACCPSDVSGWLDSDGDGISDRCDLDDDNDGILDIDEMECLNFDAIKPTLSGAVITYPNTGMTPFTATFSLIGDEGQAETYTTSIFGYTNIVAVGTQEDTDAIISIDFDRPVYRLDAVLDDVDYWESATLRLYDAAGNLIPGNIVQEFVTHVGDDIESVTYPEGQSIHVSNISNPHDFSGETVAVRLTLPFSIGVSRIEYEQINYTGWNGLVLLNGCVDIDTDGDGVWDRLDLDSDGDGCPDAIEGDENVEQSHLNPDGSINIDANGGIDANGVPNMVNSGGAADVGGDQGQGVGNSRNSNINDCPFPDVCTTGNCNDNAFLNTDDPNTLEYDNLISGFHSTIARLQDGSYLIWGQGAKPGVFGEHLYEPTPITYENGFEYTGDILKATLGTYGVVSIGWDHYAILTTDGLYIWGGKAGYDAMVHSSVKGTITFDKMTDANITNANPDTGLPMGVAPTDVKMLFGSYATLGIVTCDGAAYVLSYLGNKNGDGTTDDFSQDQHRKWHRVSVGPDKPLNRIVAMRGVTGAMVALTSEGELYTWGSDTYLGDGSSKEDRLYATKMTLPAGVKPKMIGMTKASAHNSEERHRNNSYYLLSTTNDLYALGDNSKRQLGTFDDTERTEWVRVKATEDTYLSNIVWISPNEHDNSGNATVTALTADGKLWGWGANSRNMLGHGSFLDYVDPRYMFGELDAENDKILAVETGGHITTIFKDCEYKLGYIGHNINGSYATSDNNDTYSPDFKFDGAKFSDLCAIPLPPYPEVIDLKACPGSTFDLMDALQNIVPEGYNLQWWTTIDRTPDTEVANPEEAEPGTYYAFFISVGSDCPLIEGEKVDLKYYEPTDEEYESCVCFRDPVITGLGSETQVGISLIKGRETLQSSDNWPQSRKSGFIALESNKQGMVVTRIAKDELDNIDSPQEGMMVYDTTDKCLKIYSDDEWRCFTKPACP